MERGGIRIAIIGLAAIVAENLLPPDERGAVELTMGDVELRALIPALHRDHAAQLIVVLSHLGFPQDCKLAATVPGIDILLSGHTHNRLEAPVVVNDTLIMQSGAHGSFVGRLGPNRRARGSLARRRASWIGIRCSNHDGQPATGRHGGGGGDEGGALERLALRRADCRRAAD